MANIIDPMDIKQIFATLWRQLEKEYGTSFSENRRMMLFTEVFPDEKIVVPLIRQLSWSHIKILIPMEESLSHRPKNR
jgi:hypothetical protein